MVRLATRSGVSSVMGWKAPSCARAGGAEDETVLVAQVGLDGAEIGEGVGGGVVAEDGAAGLTRELFEDGGAGEAGSGVKA